MLAAIITASIMLLLAIIGSAWRTGFLLGRIESKQDAHAERLDRIEAWQDRHNQRRFRNPKGGR